MADHTVIKARYHKAPMCATCIREKNRYCQLLCIPVRPDGICVNYEGAPEKGAVVSIRCWQCKFGKEGDNSCKYQNERKERRDPCFQGKLRYTRKPRKQQ